MVMFAMTVWDDLFHNDAENIRQEQEREARRLEHMEVIKNLE